MSNDDGESYTLFRSSDLYFCAYLCAIDIPLESTEADRNESGGKKVTFVFRVPKKDIERLKASYFGGQGTCKVLKYVQQLRSLKSLCYV